MKGMEIKQLRCFVAVAKELHFARAAERLGVDQSLLSRQVRSLEQTLGMPLLRRTTRKTQLTPTGKQLLIEVVRVLEIIDAIEQAVIAHRGCRAAENQTYLCRDT